MYPDKPRPRIKRSGVDKEEERAWVGFYRRVRSDAAIATEVLAQLEADPESKRAHLALYLCCRESLRMHKVRQQRNRRIGQGLHRLIRGTATWLAGVFRQIWSDGHEIAMEALPEADDSTSRRAHGDRSSHVLRPAADSGAEGSSALRVEAKPRSRAA